MSKFVNFQTKFTDGKLLIEALALIGLTGIQNHIGNPVLMVDYVGSSSQQQYADIYIPRKQLGRMSNDMGFKRTAKGTYEAIISDFDQRKYNSAWLNQLTVEYSEVELKAKAKKLGFKLVNTGLKENGNRKYKFQQA